MFQKIIAGCSAAMLCASCLSLPTVVSAAESQILWEKSDMLYYDLVDSEGNVTLKAISDSQVTGQIAITIHQVPVHVSISRNSSEAPLTYYDAELFPVEGQDSTTYVFLVDYSECPMDLSKTEITYTSPYLTQIYSAAYTVSLNLSSGSDASYTEEGLIISDVRSETINGTTTYAYDVVAVEDLSSDTVVSDPEAVAENGNLTVSRTVQMDWKPYALGDVNDDDSIDADDAYLILLYYAKASIGSDLPENVNAQAADADGDGAVTADDAYLVLKYYAMSSVGTDMTFPAFIASL